MREKLKNYLRAFRKRTGLSQKEISFLLGIKNGAKVSRYEHFKQKPTLKTAFRYAVIFGKSTKELFAGIFEKVERETKGKIKRLVRKISKDKPDGITKQKLDHLNGRISETGKKSN